MFKQNVNNGNGIGNFVQTTPVIKRLSQYYGSPITLETNSKFVEDVYKECDFISIQKKTQSRFPCGAWEKSGNYVTEADYIMNRFCKELGIQPDFSILPFCPRISKPEELQKTNKYVVFAFGCADKKNTGEAFDQKNIPAEYFKKASLHFREKGYTIVGVGESDTFHRISFLKEIDQNAMFILDSPIKTVGAISNCNYYIGNDTGMTHIAGCFNLPMFVFWKDTQFFKNLNASEYCWYSQKENWGADLGNWLQNVK